MSAWQAYQILHIAKSVPAEVAEFPDMAGISNLAYREVIGCNGDC
jgi:hypothetical protein